MTINKVGIIGNGFVGNAVRQSTSLRYETRIFDIIPEKSENNLPEIWECDLIFICLPTPMKNAEGSECDLTALESIFKIIPKDLKSILVIKSTVPIGTTSRLQKDRKDLKIFHNPEFLTAANAIEDYRTSTRNIIGSDQKDIDKELLEFFLNVQPNANMQVVSTKESEMIKYFANTFLAIKVAYFNLVYDTCEYFGCEYENVSYGISSDNRIGKSHTKVPGVDGERGFGGACFPKDISSLIFTLKEIGLEDQFLSSIWEYNKKIRKDWDWANNFSSVSREQG